jgi:MOSC domain-containing protein YiiM
VVRNERCDECQFDSADWTTHDLVGTITALGPWWRETVRWLNPDVLSVRPAPLRWSALEYAIHSRDLTGLLGQLFHAVLTVEDLELSSQPPAVARAGDPQPVEDVAGVIDELDNNANRFGRRAAKVKDEGWRRTLRLDGETVDAADVLAHAVHDATHHLMDVGRGLHRLGAAPMSGTGSVAQINVSSGGVPKRAIDLARIDKRGVAGDRQKTLRHHGRPWQALCLWSVEVIESLRAEGHPIAPGSAGENITITGLDWRELRPGIRIQIGEALIETSLYALPCYQNAQWFLDGDFERMDHRRQRGVSRLYAWVRTGGDVRVGDPVVVEP